MSAIDIVLFLHITTALSAFFLSGALHSAEYLVGGSTTVAELKRVTRTFRFGPVFAPIILAFVGTGMALVGMSKSPEKFSVGDPFAWTALVVLGVLFLDGPIIMGRHASKLSTAMSEAPDGPIPPALRALACDATTWMTGHANTFAVVGVVLNMATKPSTVVCIVDIVVGTVVGATLGLVLSQRALSRG